MPSKSFLVLLHLMKFKVRRDKTMPPASAGIGLHPVALFALALLSSRAASALLIIGIFHPSAAVCSTALSSLLLTSLPVSCGTEDQHQSALLLLRCGPEEG